MNGRIEKINDSAYFIVDIRSFSSSISHYDPVLANQTICYETLPGVEQVEEKIGGLGERREEFFELDISDLLLKDEDFRKSIERAREEMKRGEYLTHEEVFGD